MQLTRAADYAVRVMIHLAGLPTGTRVSRDDLAQAAECPEQFLSKVLQGLTRAGLIVSHRGNTGGFELPSPNRSATMLDIVEAIEGPLHLNVCLASDHACARQSWCPAHEVWQQTQAAMIRVLKSASIDDLAVRAAAARPAHGVVIDHGQRN
ncbi:MAG TPA: Rrf2 family transcriptional regulator [Bryobacteraceae bacterium]|nr:Rrf2 family transcriptional regulator [Bryobacteraceae bacterium]